MAAAMSGAVDLAAVKARSEAQARAATAPPPASGRTAVEVDETTFQAEVIDRSFQVPVLLEFTVAREPAAAEFTAALQRAAEQAGGRWVLAVVDAEASPRLTQSLQVRAVPTVLSVVGGQLVPELAFQGALPPEQLTEFLAALVQVGQQAGLTGAPPADDDAEPQTPSDPRLDAAEDALQDGDFDLAEQRYRAVLDAEPAHAEAKAALLQVQVLRRWSALPPDALAAADADPGDVARQLVAADALFAAQRVDDALDRLLTTLTRAAGEDRDAVRERLVEYFEVLGPDDPRVGPARRRLAAALF